MVPPPVLPIPLLINIVHAITCSPAGRQERRPACRHTLTSKLLPFRRNVFPGLVESVIHI